MLAIIWVFLPDHTRMQKINLIIYQKNFNASKSKKIKYGNINTVEELRNFNRISTSQDGHKVIVVDRHHPRQVEQVLEMQDLLCKGIPLAGFSKGTKIWIKTLFAIILYSG